MEFGRRPIRPDLMWDRSRPVGMADNPSRLLTYLRPTRLVSVERKQDLERTQPVATHHATAVNGDLADPTRLPVGRDRVLPTCFPRRNRHRRPLTSHASRDPRVPSGHVPARPNL
jgi:hypothetical protein